MKPSFIQHLAQNLMMLLISSKSAALSYDVTMSQIFHENVTSLSQHDILETQNPSPSNYIFTSSFLPIHIPGSSILDM